MATEFLKIGYLPQNDSKPYEYQDAAKDIYDQAIVGLLNVDMTIDFNYTLDNDLWKNKILIIDTVHTIDVSLFVPDNEVMVYIIINNTAVNITFSTVSGTGILVLAGTKGEAYSNGTDIKEIV